jgi:hypothetical protein
VVSLVLCALGCNRSEATRSEANGSEAKGSQAAAAAEVAASAAQTDKPEQVVQRINPAPAAAAPVASASATPPGSGSAGSPTSGGQAITPKHLEAELNRLEAELTR